MASTHTHNSLAVKKVTGDPNGAPTNVKDLSEITYHWFSTAGAFSGTYSLQGSVDDGAHWFDLVTGINAENANGTINKALSHIRTKVTADNADPNANTIECHIAGRHNRAEG